MLDEPLLLAEGLSAEVIGPDGAEPALEALSVRLDRDRTAVVIGPPWSGLTSLPLTILGHAGHRVTGGRLRFRGDDITGWPTEARAKAGLFLARPGMTGPSGVSVLQLVGRALGSRDGLDADLVDLRASLLDWANRLGADPAIVDRPLATDVTPVEARRRELLQAAVLQPGLIILDETSANTDLADEDLATVTGAIRSVQGRGPTLGTLIVTHCQRLLDHLAPDDVHIMVGGRIVASGGPELATRLEDEGYESFT